jgi:hypothetical protein
MQIYIEVKSVYGKTLIYPACDKAVLFCKLTGNKTLSHADLIAIERLGYTIETKTPAWR